MKPRLANRTDHITWLFTNNRPIFVPEGDTFVFGSVFESTCGWTSKKGLDEGNKWKHQQIILHRSGCLERFP